MKYTKWNLSACSPSALESMENAGFPALTAAVLCSRGIDTPEKAASFLNCDLSLLHDPFLMKDMDRAVERISAAVENGEKIAVYGDYDVDGITSTALLTAYLRSQGAQTKSYIPDRLEEGYGLNIGALQRLRREGISLVITVDCGITAVEETAFANSIGMDIVVTDHHECKDELPAACAVVNPHRPDCEYPFKSLAGVGVALKLVLALGGEENRTRLLAEYLDLAAIGTVADVMEITGENRAIVRTGLEFLSNSRRPGLRMLLREAGAEGHAVSVTTIGFSLAPRLNASGRMGCANLACELLLTDSAARGEELARDLCTLNRERRAIESAIFDECLARLSRCKPGELSSIVLADDRWHQGVVGIVASRLSERYSCPTFMICLNEGKGKGSCRSYGGINLFQALEACSDLLESFGGHELAAGFTILEKNIEAFRVRMDRYIRSITHGEEITSVLDIDVEISDARLVTLPETEALQLLEPTGPGNQLPVFRMSGVQVQNVSGVGGGRHSKFRFRKDGILLDAIFFSVSPQECGVNMGDRADIAFNLNVNEYRGMRSVQLQLIDIRPALTQSQSEQLLYRRYRSGEVLSPREAAMLIPAREDFVAVWRYLTRYAAPGMVEETAPRLARKIARTFGLRETYTRTMVCLDVLDERGLISLSTETDHLQITVLPVTGKVDLEASMILENLRRYLENG